MLQYFLRILMLALTVLLVPIVTARLAFSKNEDELTYRGMTIKSLARTSATNFTIHKIQLGLNTMPDTVLRKIASVGFCIVTSPTVNTAIPESKELYGGLAEPDHKRCLIFERPSPSTPFQGEYLIGVTRHELGHLFDDSSGLPSHSKAFINAVEQDNALTSKEFRDNNPTLVRDTEAARAEVFADLVNLCCTPQVGLYPDQLARQAAYPRACAVLMQMFPPLSYMRQKEEKENSLLAPLANRATGAAFDGVKEYDLAVDFANRQLHPEAVNTLTKLIDSGYTTPEAYYFRGNEHFVQKDYEKAIDDYSFAINKCRNRPLFYLRRAYAYIARGQNQYGYADLDTARRLTLQAGEYVAIKKIESGANNLTWRYTFNEYPDWNKPDFKDVDWQLGKGPFGTAAPEGVTIQTVWNTPDIYLRTKLKLGSFDPTSLYLWICHDDSVEVYADGELIEAQSSWTNNKFCASETTANLTRKLKTGAEVLIAVHGHNVVRAQNLEVQFVQLSMR